MVENAIKIGFLLFTSECQVSKEEGVVQEQQKYPDDQEVSKGGTQKFIMVSSVKREGTLVIQKILTAFALLAVSAILAHVKCSDTMIQLYNKIIW